MQDPSRFVVGIREPDVVTTHLGPPPSPRPSESRAANTRAFAPLVVALLVVGTLLGKCTLAVVDRPAFLGLASTSKGASFPDAERVVVFLHGVGGDEDSLVWLAGELESRGAPARTRYIFLEAPFTRTPGYAWFPTMNPRELEESRRRIDAFVDGLLERGVPASHLYLAGFSQGATMAILVASGRSERLGGYLALSPCAYQIDWNTVARSTPTHPRQRGLLTPGRADRICPIARTEGIRDALTQSGDEVSWVPFSDDHVISPEGQLGMVAFLRGAAPASPPRTIP